MPVCLKRKCYPVAVVCNVLYMSIRYIWCLVLFTSTVSLLIFYVDDLSIVASGLLKFPTITVLLSISATSSVNMHFIHLGAQLLGICYYNCYMLLKNLPLYYYIMTLFLMAVFHLKSMLSDISDATSTLFWLPFAWTIFFNPSLLAYVCP